MHRIITFFLQSSVFNLTNGITMMALPAHGFIVILELSKGSSFGRERNPVNPLLSYYLKLLHFSKAHEQFKGQLQYSLAESLFSYNIIFTERFMYNQNI